MSSFSSPAPDGLLDRHYVSVDSAPAKLTRPLSPWSAPAVLVIFVLVAGLMLLAVDAHPVLAAAFPQGDLVFSPYSGSHSIPLRIFILSFYIAFAAVVGTRKRDRTRFLVELIASYVLICGLFDLINILAFHAIGLVYSLHVVEILSGLIGFFVFSLKLLDHGSMPGRVTVPRPVHRRRFAWTRLGLAVAGAIAVSVMVDRLGLPLVGDLRQVALLGGTGPGVFLFLPVLFLILYVWGTLTAVLRPRRAFAPPVSIIIPAHNEAHVIRRTLTAVDAAARDYDGRVKVLVLNNNSTDDTAEIARAVLARLSLIQGRVVNVPTPGKAVALNRGVEEVDTDYMIRIDADTQILPHTLARAMRHFADPQTGIVGGVPIPPGDGPFDRARLIEVLLKHGYYQIAYGAIDAIVGVPGMFAAYRTDAVRAAGGFVQGMNGEDTDVSLRIGEMGYRVIGDPQVHYVSEVPASFHHLREQRLRWFRSVYHVSARNRTYLDDWRPSLRGKAILPFMLLNSARRAMTVPLFLFSLLYYVIGPSGAAPLTLQAVLAVLVGAPALMGAFAVLVNGRPRALLGLPEYVLFRVLRSYLTLESVLSIAFAPRRNR
ncbi:glycosyltransferase [Devosia sediminis]|uniref:Glycosyltransferase family 2 protein n=1 Tax=Devosia sediminis TaxID=2798801 RepID=A0A934MSI3_9HYPH|nr:glycosyltransferase [Devosia sediminis]MBJ3786484.1 glycosyltransferase family 2 protein [Devosia sediminis]